MRAEEECERDSLEVDVRPRSNGRENFAGCGQRASSYDSLKPRRFRFVPVSGLPTFFVYTLRRIHCPRCGRAKVEVVRCADDKHRLVEALDWFLSSWARRVSWKETAEVFGVNWNPFHRAVRMAVTCGRERVSLEGVAMIGADEIVWWSGHLYLILVLYLNPGR